MYWYYQPPSMPILDVCIVSIHVYNLRGKRNM